METPSSTRRVTRSQTSAGLNKSTNNTKNILFSKKLEETEKLASKSRRGSNKQNQEQQQEERSALIDITNDSPIVGVAMGISETPLSGMVKQRSSRAIKKTPGSGEALLRGQVKSLLQKVEEEAEISKLAIENRPMIRLQGFISSPMGITVAPTPANTPLLPNLSGSGLDIFTPLPVVEETMNISQVIMNEELKEESIEIEKSVTRSLMLDFSSEKSQDECSNSTLTTASETKEKSMISTITCSDDESSSIWSIQANASSVTQEEEEEYDDDVDDDDDDYYYYQEQQEDGRIDEICEGIKKISVNEFKGKHTIFVYGSDDEEIQRVETVRESENSIPLAAATSDVEDGVLRLKGLPTPKGKHTRFYMEDESD